MLKKASILIISALIIYVIITVVSEVRTKQHVSNINEGNCRGEIRTEYFDRFGYSYEDKTLVFVRAGLEKVVVETSDIRTFECLLNGERVLPVYGLDKNNVYFKGEMIFGADPKTFSLTIGDSKRYYASDRNGVFLETLLIEGADPETFEWHSSGYGLDETSVFYLEERIGGADRLTFEIIESGYAKDDNNVYYNGKTIDADSSSFEYIAPGIFKDSTQIYAAPGFKDNPSDGFSAFDLDPTKDMFTISIKDKGVVYLINGDDMYAVLNPWSAYSWLEYIPQADRPTLEVIEGLR